MKCVVPECEFMGPVGRGIMLVPTGCNVPGSHGIKEFRALCGKCAIREKTEHEYKRAKAGR